jgi:arylsulfatase A-like enzyme
VGEWRDTPFGNYIHGLHYFDQALGEFLAALKRAGELARTMVVVTGDHSAGFPWTPELAHAFGFGNNLLNWTLADRVPLVIKVPGSSAQRIEVPVGQVDLAPTVLNLLGIDAAGLPYVGRNLLGSPGDEPVVRRNGSWVDARHLFLLRSGTTGTHCYDRARLIDVPLKECEAGSATAALQVEMARRVREFDLQQRLLAESFASAPK